MRVITGLAKGKKLVAPKDERVRPTSDRVKQSLFNIIDPLISDAIFVDCFSGTGAIGIEALSRGAKEVYFIDHDKDSIQLIKKNLELTHLQANSKVLNMNIESAISTLASKKLKADIIFMDPPYQLDITEQLILRISECKLLNEDGVIIIEHDITFVPVEVIEDYRIVDKRVYGKTAMTYYSK